jgi:Fibronectin type III domain
MRCGFFGPKIAGTKAPLMLRKNISVEIRGGMIMDKRLGRIVAAFIFLLLPVSEVFAAPMLAWEASSGEVTGYKVYYGTAQGTYNQNKNVGNVTQYSLSSLPLTEKQTYYFVARAYNAAGESGNSNMVSWTVPDYTAPMPPQGITVK